MSDDDSSFSENDCEEPLFRKHKRSGLKGKQRFKNVVLTKVMGKTVEEEIVEDIIKENILKNKNESIKSTNSNDNRDNSFLTNRNSSPNEKTQGRRDTDILDSAEVKDLEWTKRCLESGSSPEATCQMAKMSVCHIAAFFGEDGILEEVLKENPRLYKRADANGRTPINYAAWEGNLDCLAILLGLKVGDFQRIDFSKDQRGKKEKTYQEFKISSEIKNAINSIKGESVPNYTNLCDSSHSCSSPTKSLDIVWSSCTPLHEACARVQTDCVLALLACGADITKRDDKGRTPLDVCGLANKNLGKIEETSGRSFSKIIEAIIRYGKLHNISKKMWLTNKPKETSPLHIAVMLGSKKATKLLLDIGAVSDLMNEDGQTPLHLAIDFKKPIILRAIANCSQKNIRHVESLNIDEYTPLQYAVKHQWVEGVSILLEANASITEQNNPKKQSALHFSAEIGNLEITDKLIEKMPNKKENIDILNELGETPLFKAIIHGKPKCVRCFLHEGAAYNINFQGFTVMHKAMQSDNIDVLFALLEAENSVDLLNIADDENGMTPLHWAAQENRSNYINILLARGADPTIQRKNDGYTPLHIAAEKGRNEAIKELLKHDKYDLMNIRDDHGWLPFHRAAHHCQRESIEIFLKNGSNLAEVVESTTTGKKKLIANIIKDNMPRSAEYFNHIFNIHMSRSNCNIDQPDCDVKFNYAIIIPNDENRHIQMSAVRALFGYGCNFELSKLILHPYIESFLYLKWTILRKFYLLILGIYSLYVLLLTDMVINIFHDDYYQWTTSFALQIKQIFMIIVIVCILILEIPFMRLKGLKYFYRGEGWVKVGSVTMSIVIMIIHRTQGVTETRLVVAIALLLSWIEITVLLSKFPQFGYYFQMFATVASRVIKVFALFGFFVVFGFSLIFWILIRQNESFVSPWNSLIKTVVMMTSEFDYSSLMEESQPSEPSEDNNFEETKTNTVVIQLFFILFLICVPIVLMNLLLALAVSDVKDLEIEGKIQRLQEQVDFLSNLEVLAWRINLRINIGQKLRVDNEMIVYPGRPYWDPSNNFPRDLMESICENIHERRTEEDKQKQIQDMLATVEENTRLIKENAAASEIVIKKLTEAIQQLSEDIKHYKPVIAETKTPASLWPSINTLKSGMVKT